MPRRSWRAAVGAVLAAVGVWGQGEGSSWAEPQLSSGLTLGGAVENVVGPTDAGGAFHLGGRTSVLFLRGRGSEVGIGPYVDAATASFRHVDLGAGGEWLLPVRDDLPVVLSIGGLLREGGSRSWTPGATGTLFWGSRSYNFHSLYGIATGIFAQTRWIPTGPATVDIVFGIQLDAELLILPAVLILEAIRHARD